jgi:hypothetical protein
MSYKPRRLASVCQQHPHLQQLNSRAQKLTQLDLILQAILPSQFVGRCSLVKLQQQQLTLLVESAALASLIRFQSAKICQHFSSQLAQPVNRLNVIVRPNFAALQPRQKLKAPAALSENNAQLIKQTAEAMDNLPLKNALTRLSSRVKNTN